MAEAETFWDRQFKERPVGQDEEWVDEPKPEQPTDETPVSQEVLGLLNLGKLVARMDVRGHEVILRTLTMDEELETGLLIRKYEGTDVWGRALATAYVAASLEAIDGKPLVQTLGPEDNIVQRKFDYVRSRMYWPVIKIIYEEGFIPLIEQQVQAIEEFQKK